jgi:electron transfer flavoprotein beta subunit
MLCLVPVKRVIDFNVKIRVKADKSGVETEHVKMSMNPFDEIAMEEAMRLKEAGIVTEIIAVSIGTSTSQETCRVALARGADSAILVETNTEYNFLEPIHIAIILKTLILEVLETQPRLVILGKQAIDDDCNQTGQMLSALLGWSQGTNASRLNIQKDLNKVDVTREVDGGLEVLSLTLPVVVTTDLRLNEPRYISLPNLMKAKSKLLRIVLLVDLIQKYNLHIKPHFKTLKVDAPLLRRSGVTVGSAQELVKKLRYEAKVIE